MKLYCHPASTTSRTVMMFAAQEKLALDQQVVDIFTGEHMQPPFTTINPSKMVPVLEDGDFRLTECSAILKYVADKQGSAAYPKDLKQRAKVNEMMDWFNTNLYRDLAYGVVYPQAFPHHKRPSDELQSGTLAWHNERARGWLAILDRDLIGTQRNYLCGDTISIADYLGAEMVAAGELIGCDYAAYPNVQRWMKNMKALPAWKQVHEVFDGFAGSLKGKAFVTV